MGTVCAKIFDCFTLVALMSVTLEVDSFLSSVLSADEGREKSDEIRDHKGV